MYLVRKQADVQESSGPVLAECNRPGYQFPTFRLSCVLPQTARFILCKASLDPIWFGLNASGLEASWCAKIIMPGLAECNQHACYQFPTFRLGCVLPQTAWIILCKASLDPVWFWLHASGLEGSRCARIIRPGSGRTQPALLPVSYFQTQLRSSTDGLDHIVQSQPGSNLVPADCVKFWPNGSSLEAGRCARITHKY